MSRLLTSFALLLAALVIVGAAFAARDPRAEKERLNPRDMAQARSELLKRADLAPG